MSEFHPFATPISISRRRMATLRDVPCSKGDDDGMSRLGNAKKTRGSHDFFREQHAGLELQNRAGEGNFELISLLPHQEGICRSCDQQDRRRYATMALQRRSLRAIGCRVRPSKAFSAEKWEKCNPLENFLGRINRSGSAVWPTGMVPAPNFGLPFRMVEVSRAAVAGKPWDSEGVDRNLAIHSIAFEK